MYLKALIQLTLSGILSIYFVEHNQKTYVGFGLGLPAGGPEHIRSMSG